MIRVARKGPRDHELPDGDVPPGQAAREPRRISSHLLLDEQGELIIDHGERAYRLKETRNGKLILN